MRARDRVIGRTSLLLALGIAAAGGGYAFLVLQPEVALDADFCAPTPARTWLVGVDQTDIQPSYEQERIIKGVLAIADRMRKQERLALHVITGRADDASAPWPAPGFPKGFRRCKAADPGSVNPAVENETLVRGEYERDFLNPLKKILPDLTKGHTAPLSPILQAVEVMMWSPHFRADVVPNRTLVLYSDLLQHTKALSQLSGPRLDPCAVLASDIGARLRAHDWRGVRVVLEYLRNPRDAARQGREHLRFWVRIFYRLGAAEVFDGKTLAANDAPTCAPITTPRQRTSKSQSFHERVADVWQ
jgi:hypothetical protein